MALIYADSWDNVVNSTAALTARGWVDQGNFMQVSVGNGRFGSNSYRCPGNSAEAYRNLPANYATLICGIAMRTSFSSTLFGFSDLNTYNVDVRCDVQRRLIVTRGGTQIGATGITQLQDSVYHYIQLKFLVSNTVGTIEVICDGTTEITGTGLDTQGGANAYSNRFHVLRSGTTTDYDDLYICDNVDSGVSGAPNNDFLGDVRVEATFPNGNGNSSQFTGNDGNSTDNYLLVDEALPNSDTDYVQSNTVTQKDTYAFTNLTPTVGTVYGLVVNAFARKTDAGNRSIANVARLSATELDSANHALSTEYGYHRDIMQSKPGTGQWSITDVNSAEFGPKVTV